MSEESLQITKVHRSSHRLICISFGKNSSHAQRMHLRLFSLCVKIQRTTPWHDLLKLPFLVEKECGEQLICWHLTSGDFYQYFGPLKLNLFAQKLDKLSSENICLSPILQQQVPFKSLHQSIKSFQLCECFLKIAHLCCHFNLFHQKVTFIFKHLSLFPLLFLPLNLLFFLDSLFFGPKIWIESIALHSLYMTFKGSQIGSLHF